MKPFIVILLGATAVGKTALSIALAKALDAEIISCDSMLLYRGFDIGTAKPTPAERGGIEHHLLDCLEPQDTFNVTDFCRLAEKCIAEIAARGKLPLLVGGTGLYMKSLLEGYNFNTATSDSVYRRQLERLAAARGNAYLHARLQSIDPKTAARLHENDIRRIIRALEVASSNEQISQTRRSASPIYPSYVIGLTRPRAEIYQRIHQRIDQMLADGLLEETQALLDAGIPLDAQAMQAIGYKEIIPYLLGHNSLDEAIDTLKKNTRHFAKRQLTWFRKMPYIHWYEAATAPDLLLQRVLWDIRRHSQSEVL